MRKLIIAIMFLCGLAQAQTVNFQDSLTTKLIDPISLAAILDVLQNDLMFHNVWPDSATLAGAVTATDGRWAIADHSLFVADGANWNRQGGVGGGITIPVLLSEMLDMPPNSIMSRGSGTGSPEHNAVGDFTVENSPGLGDWLPFWENTGELRKMNLSAFPMVPTTTIFSANTTTLDDTDINQQFEWGLGRSVPTATQNITVDLGITNNFIDIQMTTSHTVNFLQGIGVTLTGVTTISSQWDWVRVRWNTTGQVHISNLSASTGISPNGETEVGNLTLLESNVADSLSLRWIEGTTSHNAIALNTDNEIDIRQKHWGTDIEAALGITNGSLTLDSRELFGNLNEGQVIIDQTGVFLQHRQTGSTLKTLLKAHEENIELFRVEGTNPFGSTTAGKGGTKA